MIDATPPPEAAKVGQGTWLQRFLQTFSELIDEEVAAQLHKHAKP
jgi:hypothetical protein